ncbi:MAG: hypothetical protein AB8B85_17555 [Paracoccaceae bacterium]
MRWLAANAPDWILNPLIRVIALYYTVFPTRVARSGVEGYFTRLHGKAPTFRQRLRQTETFAHVILDRVRLLGHGFEGYEVTATGKESVERSHFSGRGGVLLGAHFGSFEALRAFDKTLPGLSVRYLMYQQNAAHITRLLEALSPEIAAQVIPVDNGQAAMLASREAIAQGDFVGFLGDRMPTEVEAGDRATVTVDFLGAPIQVPRAPYLVAMLAEAPLILCFAPRLGARHYEISFVEIHDGAPVARGDRANACQRMAQSYAEALAGQCRRHPHNWFNFFDIWG